MPEMRGTDLVVEYLVQEQVAVPVRLRRPRRRRAPRRRLRPPGRDQGGVPADRVGRRLHGRRLLPRLRAVIPVYTSTGPGPMLLTVAIGERVLRLVGVHRDHRPGRDEPVRLGRAPGGVPPPPGRLPDDRQADHEAQLPGALGRGPREVPPEGLQARPHRPPGPGPHRHPVRPLDPHRRRRGAGAGGALADAELAHARLARGRRAARSTCSCRRGGRSILAGGGVICSDASVELAAFAEHVNVPVYSSFMGKGALSARAPAPPRASPAAGASTRPPRRPATPT